MSDIQCARCGKHAPQLPSPPTPGELGNKVYDSICQDCWKEWLRQQTALINHHGLNLRDPKAKAFLTEQTEAFLFGQPQAQS